MAWRCFQVYSYFESRGCDREAWNEAGRSISLVRRTRNLWAQAAQVVFFGLQYFMKRYLTGKAWLCLQESNMCFEVITRAKIDEAVERLGTRILVDEQRISDDFSPIPSRRGYVQSTFKAGIEGHQRKFDEIRYY